MLWDGEDWRAASTTGNGADMENDKSITEATENPAKDDVENAEDGRADGTEFKITVRKLEMPVRPRGVLAE